MIGPVVAPGGGSGDIARRRAIPELGGVTVLALAVRRHRKVVA